MDGSMFREFLASHRLGELLKEAFKPFPCSGDRVRWGYLSEEKKDILIRWGEDALLGYPQLTATQFLAYSRTGERGVFETPYFSRRKLVFGAALAECVENKGRFVDAVIDGIWLICEETSWVVSAHNNQEPDDMYPFQHKSLPDENNPYVDLFAAQTASVLSYVLYFMKEKLDAVSPLIAARAEREIEKRIIHPFMTHNDFWWMGYGSKVVNNWNPWILSNVIDTVLLTEKDPLRKEQAISRAMIMLDHYLAAMPADGGCDEGAGYFNAAGASLLDCLESLHCASEGKIDFYNEPHIAAIGSYPAKVHIAGKYYLNFADCDAKPFVDGERLYTYGKRTGNQELMKLGAAIFTGSPLKERIMIQDTPQVNRVLFSLFLDIEDQPEPEPEPFMQLPDLQVFAWYQNGIFAAIKGGHNDESHNHNDIGSFMVYADGEPEVIDMGNKVYTAATFGPNRYQLNNTRSKNHNVPLIGSTEQRAGRVYAAKNVMADQNGVRLDIADAYPAEAKVDSLIRTFSNADGKVTLSDTVKLTEPQTVTWTFMLRNEPVVKQGEIHFGKLKLLYHPSLNAAVEKIPVDDKRMQRSFPGNLWRLTLEAPQNTMHQYTFEMKRI